jgi:hypothetical protein
MATLNDPSEEMGAHDLRSSAKCETHSAMPWAVIGSAIAYARAERVALRTWCIITLPAIKKRPASAYLTGLFKLGRYMD